MRGSGLGAMAYWNGRAYFAASDDYLRGYSVTNGQIKAVLSSRTKFADPGATPSVSANGHKDGIVWAISTKVWNGPDTTPAVLYGSVLANSESLSTPLNKIHSAIAPDWQRASWSRSSSTGGSTLQLVAKSMSMDC
jgi:hypothetical protein